MAVGCEKSHAYGLQTCVEADNADAAQVKAEAEAPEDFKEVYYVDYVKEVPKYE